MSSFLYPVPPRLHLRSAPSLECGRAQISAANPAASRSGGSVDSRAQGARNESSKACAEPLQSGVEAPRGLKSHAGSGAAGPGCSAVLEPTFEVDILRGGFAHHAAVSLKHFPHSQQMGVLLYIDPQNIFLSTSVVTLAHHTLRPVFLKYLSTTSYFY